AGEMGWSRTEVSAAFTVAVLSVAATSPVIGRLLDRFPPRRVVLPSIVIWGLGFASLSLLTRHLAHLLAVYVVMGIVGIPTTQLGYAKIVSAWFDAARGRALAAIMAGSGIGFMVFPPLAQALISAYGWRAAYAILGALVLVLALPLSFLFLYAPEEMSDDTEISPHSAVRYSLAQYVKTLPFIGIVAALLLFSFATNGLNTHWAALLTDRGLSPATAAKVLSVAGLATLASKLLTGPFLDRLRANRVAALLFLCTAVGLALLVSANKISISYSAAIFVGIGMGAEADVVPYLLTRYFGLARFSELYSYTWTVYAVAGALGPLLAGYVFDRAGTYRAAILVFLGMVLAASGVLFSLPKYVSERS
ncbi:MAG TPA: MFS transporter, partial [Bryobacteraceae bacterium]